MTNENEIVAAIKARKAALKENAVKAQEDKARVKALNDNNRKLQRLKEMSSEDRKKHNRKSSGVLGGNFQNIKKAVASDLAELKGEPLRKGRKGHVNDYVKPADAIGNKMDCKNGSLKVEINRTKSNDFSPVKKLPEVENFYKGETKKGCATRHYQHANYVDTAKKQPTINGRIFGVKGGLPRTDIKDQNAKTEAMAATKAAKAAQGNS